MYLLFEIISVISVNTLYLLQIKYNQNILASIQNYQDILHNIAVVELLKSLYNIFISIRRSFVLLIVKEMYHMICKPFDFKELTQIRQVMKRYLITIAGCLIFRLIQLFKMAESIFVILSREREMILNSSFHQYYLFEKRIPMIATDIFLFALYHIAMLLVSIKQCSEIKKTLAEMNASLSSTISHHFVFYRMTVVLIVIIGLSCFVEINVIIIRDLLYDLLNIQSYKSWMEMFKTICDTIFNITVMITFSISFPRLRPRMNDEKKTMG